MLKDNFVSLSRMLASSARLGSISIVVAMMIFVLAEPTISFSATSATNQFTISQAVTAEVSFKTPGTNVTMAPSIGGLTGGEATGTTQVVVTTNDHLGYQMTLQATSTSGAMTGNIDQSNTIPGYTWATTPDFNFTVAANSAAFGYTVEASTTDDLVSYFKYTGSTCNTGTSNGLGHCWMPATSTAFTIVSTSGATTASGSTTTLDFHVKIAANPSPVIPDDTYVATTTLTASIK